MPSTLRALAAAANIPFAWGLVEGGPSLKLPKGFVLPPDPKPVYSDDGKAIVQAKVGRVVVGRIAVSGFTPSQEKQLYPPSFKKVFGEGPCLADYEAACAAVGRPLGYYIPDYVEVVPELQGKGVGAGLYVRASQLAAKNDCLLVASPCVGVPMSPSAAKVWSSKTFRSAVRMFGPWISWGGAS